MVPKEFSLALMKKTEKHFVASKYESTKLIPANHKMKLNGYCSAK